MNVRDSVRFFHPVHQKKRTGVIVWMQDDRAVVIFGRGSAFEGERVDVRFPSSEATQVDLIKTTYFYPTSIVRIRTSAAERVGHCPPQLFLELRRLATMGIRHLTTIE